MIRIGMIGTGRIAKRFIKELEHVEGASVPCVFNPHGASANEFVSRLQDDIAGTVPNAVNGISRFSLPEPFNKIDEIWDKIDAVYIASPHGTHMAYIMQALKHGKNVLCEKPMSLKKADVIKAYEYANDKSLVLMEGLKTAYMPGFKNLLEVIETGVIGDVVHVKATFTKLVSKYGREYTDNDASGSFLELGSYGMLAVFSILGVDYTALSFETVRNEDSVDIYTIAEFKYKKSFGTVTTGIGVKSEGSLVIAGTEGYIVVQAPWWLTNHFEVHFEDPNKVISYDNELKGDGLRYEINEFVARINEEKASVDLEKMSIAMAGVVESYRE